MGYLGSDLRYALRGLRRSPGFALTAIGSLAVGLGASLAVFTIADNLLLRPLPYKDPSRLVMLWGVSRIQGGEGGDVRPGDYLDWARDNGKLEVAGVQWSRAVLVEGDRAEEFRRQDVTPSFPSVLGVSPVRGRWFTEEEHRAAIVSPDVAVISYRLWQSWFGGREDVIGRRVQINSSPRTIVGVMPPGFYFFDREIDVWQPLGLNPAIDNRTGRGRDTQCVGRLRDGVSMAEAQSFMTAVGARLEEEYPATNRNLTVRLQPLRDALLGKVKTSLIVLLAAVGMMLAVACANVANLLLARHTTRQREIAVRASLGAPRSRLIWQLLTESLTLAIAGGAAGILFANWAVRALVALAPENLTHYSEIHVDLRVYAAALALSIVSGVLFGIAPAFIASRSDLARAFRGDNRSGIGAGSQLRLWLVGAEVAMCVVLLTGAGLLFRSLVALHSVAPGLDANNLLTFRVSLPLARYATGPARKQFLDRTMDELAHVPGVRSVTAVNHPPFSGHGTGTYANIEGRPPARVGDSTVSLVRAVMPGYFQTLGIPLKRGRDFTPADDAEDAPRRVIVNEAFVRIILGGEEPLGKKLNLYVLDPKDAWSEIIGVVGDMREWAIDRDPDPMVFHVYSHFPRNAMIFLVRTDLVRGDRPMSFAEPARKIVQRLDASQPIAEVRTLETILGENYARQRFSTWLLSGFAAVALALAAVGIYGVLAYSVTARTREFGVRTALGADARRIVTLVLTAGAKPVVCGIAIGTAGALAMAGLIRGLLFHVAPHDPVTFVIAPCVLGAIGLLAACIPAARAARVDPMEALRSE